MLLKKDSDKSYHRDEACLYVGGDKIYTLGFSSHPMTRMWIGYVDSLKMYINNHIDEYNSRKTHLGTQCHISLPKFELPNKIIHPWWITDTNLVIDSHISSLLRKEISRKERVWYQNMSLFNNDYIRNTWLYNYGYV